MKTADPKLVSLELDIMWSQVAGVNPVEVLKRYGKRVALMHLKNVAKDVPQRFNEQVPRTAFREVGNGVINIAVRFESSSIRGRTALLRGAGPDSGRPARFASTELRVFEEARLLISGWCIAPSSQRERSRHRTAAHRYAPSYKRRA